MKTMLNLLYAAIFFFSFTTVSVAGTAAGVGGSIDNEGPTAMQNAEINFNDSTAVENTLSIPVPEPATMFLVGTGLVAIAGIGRKKLLNKKEPKKS